MKHVKYLALALCIGSLSPVMAQTASRSLTVDNLVAWQRISGQTISDNGMWVACKMEPWEGDAVVNLYDAQGKELATFPQADRFLFSASSDYLVVSQKPGRMMVDSLKLKKTKKEKMPMDALVIYSLSGNREVIDSLKTFKMAEKTDWLAFQRGRKDSTLYIRPLNAKLSIRYEIPAVKAFNFAEKSGMLYYITAGDKAEEKPGLYLLNTETGVKTLVKEGNGVFKQVAFDEDGANLAFLYCAQKDSCYKAMALCLSLSGCGNSGKNEAVVLDFSEPTAYAQEVDSAGLVMRFGDLQSVHQDGEKVIVKAKIEPNLTSDMTVKQNFFAVADLIKNHGFNTCGELEFWAVADMTNGSEEKVVQFTLEKDAIDGIYDETILDDQVGDHVVDLWVHNSLKQEG